MSINELAENYNQFPYDSLAVKQTHPWHLYRVATLYGFSPVDVAKAKVLELGCASGGNLIPMAYHLPTTNFVGIDLAKRQIEEGAQQISDLQLQNIELYSQSIMDFQSNKQFDYIICHGLYSWVSHETREQVLALCRQYLSPQGLAYISYNTYPGWQAGDTVRELLKWQTAMIPSPLERIQKAKEVLVWLENALINDYSPYASLMKNEIDLMKEHSDHQLLHEHLSPFNEAYYFLDFLEQAKQFQLGYIGDAFLSNDLYADFQEVQRSDYLLNRRFRCSLLCQQNEAKLRNRDPKIFEALKSVPNFAGEMTAKTTFVAQKPRVCPLVLYQASHQDFVTNQRHENIQLNPVAEIMLPYLDSHHDLNDLVAFIFQEIENETIVLVDKQGIEIQDRNLGYQHVVTICQETLALMAQNALFI
ncbi:methyltransferase [Candidatus Berkiella aquae]|uniref:Class I SAM-dependent methyltransferase n=1 Tax=Candidatus Berkiella aquae TaxID=295108 RepID=A0AAE3L7S4_9GAMM|nr:class I SAM-dependent methyltransferase [Candidatus Berkiella aquae]MCS5710190.1 class I SAM-dependent methyltransferase [Candidatus Berkiella aquae]